jgi:hypothetical protein
MSITTHFAMGLAALLAIAEVTAAAAKSQQQIYAALGSSKAELQIEACVQVKLQENQQTGPIPALSSTKRTVRAF